MLQDNCFFVVQDLSEVVGILGRDELEDFESLLMHVAQGYSDLEKKNI